MVNERPDVSTSGLFYVCKAQLFTYIHVNQKDKIMTKKEIKSAINKAVYQFAESLGYSMFDDNDGSYVTFMKMGANYDDCIDYMRSDHSTVVLNWASDEIKDDAKLIAMYAQNQKRKYEQ